MMKRFYDATSLRANIEMFEAHYGISTEDFLEAHARDDESVARVPRHQRVVWSSMHLNWRRMTEDQGFSSAVARELELA